LQHGNNLVIGETEITLFFVEAANMKHLFVQGPQLIT